MAWISEVIWDSSLRGGEEIAVGLLDYAVCQNKTSAEKLV